MKEDIKAQKLTYPKALVAVHPECSREVRKIADFVGSTSQICRYVNTSPAKMFIIGTEVGILHKLRKENPSKQFFPAYGGATCNVMKLTTLEKLYRSLKEEQICITIPRSMFTFFFGFIGNSGTLALSTILTFAILPASAIFTSSYFSMSML